MEASGMSIRDAQEQVNRQQQQGGIPNLGGAGLPKPAPIDWREDSTPTPQESRLADHRSEIMARLDEIERDIAFLSRDLSAANLRRDSFNAALRDLEATDKVDPGPG